MATPQLDPELKQLDPELKQRMEARKNTKKTEPRPKVKELEVSKGPVGQIVDVLVNPGDDKMLEFTSLDQNQVRLIPELVLIDDEWEYCMQVATYRYDAELWQEIYDKGEDEKPVRNNQMKRFIFVTAQCRRSLNGKAYGSLADLALADIETRAGKEEGVDQFGNYGFEE